MAWVTFISTLLESAVMIVVISCHSSDSVEVVKLRASVGVRIRVQFFSALRDLASSWRVLTSGLDKTHLIATSFP